MQTSRAVYVLVEALKKQFQEWYPLEPQLELPPEAEMMLFQTLSAFYASFPKTVERVQVRDIDGVKVMMEVASDISNWSYKPPPMATTLVAQSRLFNPDTFDDLRKLRSDKDIDWVFAVVEKILELVQ